MRLASAADVLLAAGVHNPPEATLRHAGAMLDISCTLLESLLETTFSAGSRVDSFSPIRSSGVREFRLTNGFVAEDSVVLYAAPASGNPFGAISSAYRVPSDQYSVSLREGVVAIPAIPYYGAHTIVVTYEHGFPATADDDTVLAVPDDLRNIAISAAILSLNTIPSTPGNRKEKAVSNVSRTLYGHLVTAVGPHRRPRLTVEYPTFTSAYG